MPIVPPNLDDRRYDEIVREARALIPGYCPEWTNLGDADPGMTLVQLFAWMTEMTIFRLNRVPDKTYIHFLNFIGEERRGANPSVVPLNFFIRTEGRDVVELPPFTRCSSKQSGGKEALHYLTSEPLTVHSAVINRLVAVHASATPMVREIPFEAHADVDQALLFGDGRGVQLFKMDPVEHGRRAYTPHQYLYLAHDDFRLMDVKDHPSNPVGKLRIRNATEENLPIGSLFRWEYRTQDGWVPIPMDEEEEEVLGLPEVTLKASLHRIGKVESFGLETDPFDRPDPVAEEAYWIRGVIDYERWLAHRMMEDLEITWRDDRGGEERLINNWDVRETGRNIEFFIQDMPPIRAGWTVRFTLVDRSMPAGRNAYYPRYRWTYRRGEVWELVPNDRVRYQGTSVVLTGPFRDMATDGFNLRAERIETVNIRGFAPDLELEMMWLRPVVTWLAYGPETQAAAPMEAHELPQLPFQPAPTLPPLLGMKFFIGSDVFENRAQKPVMLEVEIGFELDSQLVEEPKDLYHMQLTYRAADTWRVVHTDDGKFNQFTFADVDPEGALLAGRRKIRIFLDPKKQLKGLFRSTVGGRETCWLRFEMSRASMTYQADKKTPPQPFSIRVYSVKLGVDGIIGRDIYEQPMPGLKVSTVEYREHNRRLSRAVCRAAGRLSEHHPFDTFIDISDAAAGSKKQREAGHHALYMRFDKPLPVGNRHAMWFKTRGETYLPEGVQVNWEVLEEAGLGRVRWNRLTDDEDVFKLNRTGVLSFPLNNPMQPPEVGVWVRALFRAPEGQPLPALPPLSHLMLNTVEGINLHEFRMEKFSGEGIPHQSVQLRRFPLFLHPDDPTTSLFPHPDRFPDMRVYVTEEDSQRKEWRRAPGNSLLTSSKDDRHFTVDAVEGTLHFGNGIRGKMLPVGNYNVTVELYHVVPGDDGNVSAGTIGLAEGFADLVGVANIMPAGGGRNAETIQEIIRRAPSVLTSRDRAVTRLDFEVIALEASGEAARAACDGRLGADGVIEVVVLPQRREGEKVPDPFLSTGLKEHVQRYLKRRCLVNVDPTVRLATFQQVDVSVTVRLRPNANFIAVRELASQWVETFLDPYDGGLDGEGWPFAGTLYRQDFGRMVSDIEDLRHVSEVRIYPIDDDAEDTAGWEKGQGSDVCMLDKRDLFVLRHVRVVSEEGE